MKVIVKKTVSGMGDTFHVGAIFEGKKEDFPKLIQGEIKYGTDTIFVEEEDVVAVINDSIEDLVIVDEEFVSFEPEPVVEKQVITKKSTAKKQPKKKTIKK